jgi:putative PIN family toxin of toxin-antitoxin system
MKIVVFDTNVLLDLFVFNDFRAIHLKQALIEGKIDALASPKTIDEFIDVIARPLFSLSKEQQAQITDQWRGLARVIADEKLTKAPWICQDPDDQVFLDIAYTNQPCTLVSKDNEVLRLAKKAADAQVLITANYTLGTL